MPGQVVSIAVYPTEPRIAIDGIGSRAIHLGLSAYPLQISKVRRFESAISTGPSRSATEGLPRSA